MNVIIDLTSPSKSTDSDPYDDLSIHNDANNDGKCNKIISLIDDVDNYSAAVPRRQIKYDLNENTKKNGNKSNNDGSNLYLSSFKDKNDNADVTEGLMELIEALGIPNLVTCFGSHSKATHLCMCCEHHSPNSPCCQVFHIMQKDKWSCGFRNTQMALSSLLPNLSRQHLRLVQNKSDEQFYDKKQHQLNNSMTTNRNRKRKFNNRNTKEDDSYVKIPSLRQIQIYLERCWKEGFDSKGAQHYNYKILDTNSFIGAVEVSSIFAYLNIDCTVIQFILCPQSRSLLGPFVWAYFTKQNVHSKCNSTLCSSKTIASQLLHIVNTNNKLANFDNKATQYQHRVSHMSHESNDRQCPRNCCTCPLIPLYLQWEGHSVTIVGIERYTSPTSQFTYDLLIFDPMKSGANIKESISLQVAKRKSIRAQSLSSSAKKFKNSHNGDEYHFGSSTSSENGRCISNMRLPVSRLSKKDCQIVLCSKQQISDNEREKAKQTTNALTAANEVVVNRLKSNGYK